MCGPLNELVLKVSSKLVVVLQVIVTTPMEMLKIQLQDAGRIGKNRDFKRGRNEGR